MGAESEKSELIIIDKQCAILVHPEKKILVCEVIKHYTPRWCGEHEKDGDDNIEKQVTTILRKMCIDFETISSITHLVVLSSCFNSEESSHD